LKVRSPASFTCDFLHNYIEPRRRNYSEIFTPHFDLPLTQHFSYPQEHQLKVRLPASFTCDFLHNCIYIEPRRRNYSVGELQIYVFQSSANCTDYLLQICIEVSLQICNLFPSVLIPSGASNICILVISLKSERLRELKLDKRWYLSDIRTSHRHRHSNLRATTVYWPPSRNHHGYGWARLGTAGQVFSRESPLLMRKMDFARFAGNCWLQRKRTTIRTTYHAPCIIRLAICEIPMTEGSGRQLLRSDCNDLRTRPDPIYSSNVETRDLEAETRQSVLLQLGIHTSSSGLIIGRSGRTPQILVVIWPCGENRHKYLW